jgi:hypothetical protein
MPLPKGQLVKTIKHKNFYLQIWDNPPSDKYKYGKRIYRLLKWFSGRTQYINLTKKEMKFLKLFLSKIKIDK